MGNHILRAIPPRPRKTIKEHDGEGNLKLILRSTPAPFPNSSPRSLIPSPHLDAHRGLSHSYQQLCPPRLTACIYKQPPGQTRETPCSTPASKLHQKSERFNLMGAHCSPASIATASVNTQDEWMQRLLPLNLKKERLRRFFFLLPKLLHTSVTTKQTIAICKESVCLAGRRGGVESALRRGLSCWRGCSDERLKSGLVKRRHTSPLPFLFLHALVFVTEDFARG